ncbi:MAG: glycosyltransferase [Candidatus Eisenbacteria bacterium]
MAERLRLCILGPAYPLRGGIAQYLAILYSLLEKNHEVHFVSFKRQYPSFLFPGKTQLDPGRPRIDVRPRALIDSVNPFSWLRTYAFLRRIRPDLLIFKWWTPFFAPCYFVLCFLARRFTGARVVFVCDNAVPHERRPGDVFLTKLAFSQVDYFVTLSNSVLAELRALKPGARAVEIAHPSYAYFTFGRVDTAVAREKLGLSGKVILFFGYVRAYKGVHFLLDAFARVREKLGATLLIVGDFYEPAGPYRERVRRLGLEDSVRIVDRYVSDEEVGLFFSAADVVVLPYTSATQSGVVQIAFAFEKPVVSTSVGGIPEVVRDGENGLLVPPCDSEALAAALLRFYAEDLSGGFAAGIKSKGYAFSWDPIVKAIEDFGSEGLKRG